MTMQTRRTFCVHACQAASLVAVGSVFQGCDESNPAGPSPSMPTLPVASSTIVNGAIVVNVDSSSPLAAVGSAALVQSTLPPGTLLVSRTAQDSFTALTAICTHEQCVVTGFENQRYVCPCHGSQYSTSGQVVNGPALMALRQFPTQFASGVLTITV
jgi:cytochrome b6-f complex iron-sulfur subunit